MYFGEDKVKILIYSVGTVFGIRGILAEITGHIY